MMISLDSLVGRVLELEESYFDLQDRYQLLIHQFETLKAEHEEISARYRNELKARQDMDSSN